MGRQVVIEAIIIAIVALGGVIGSVWSYRKGRKGERADAQIQEFNEYVETRKRMEAADPGDDVDKWLRERAKRDGNL